MAAPRKYPPKDAVQTIERLAAEGHSIIGVARHLGVSRECFKRWIDEDESLNEAFELGRETERQALHAMVVASARANKPANVNAFFLLKARHGYIEADNRNGKVSLDVVVSNVLVVRDHGTDEEWAAKVAAQQRALTHPEPTPNQLGAPLAAQVDTQPYFGPPVILAPAHAPQTAPVPTVMPPEPVSASAAPSWRPRS